MRAHPDNSKKKAKSLCASMPSRHLLQLDHFKSHGYSPELTL